VDSAWEQESPASSVRAVLGVFLIDVFFY